MRPAPERFVRLPEQYFAALLGRVAAASALHGEEVIDLGRGNPELAPPPHVAEALARAAVSREAAVHGYAPFSGLPALKEAVAERYRTEYGVALDPVTEVAIVPGIKTALVEFALCVVEEGEALLLPDPGYPDYLSAVALAGARVELLPIEPRPDLANAPAAAALYLNYPSNPVAVAAPEGVFADAVRYAERTGAAVLHDFAYGDLVFDGRRPASFLAEPGAKQVGVELFSMSKSYGMAGWRLGFVVGNAELVHRVEVLQGHLRAGIFAPLQEAAIAALLGPQDTVAERRVVYQARRDRVVAALEPLRPRSEGTFFVWLRLPEGATAERLLLEHRVAVAPGEGFGERGRGYVRISLATSDAALDLGLERLRRALCPG